MKNTFRFLDRNLLGNQLEVGKLHSSLPTYERLLEYSIDAIRIFMSMCPRRYQSISFGKQSLVLAHMVYEIDPSTPMYFLASSESWLLHNFAEIIDKFYSKWKINLTIVQTNRLAMDIEPYIEYFQIKHPTIKWKLVGWESEQLSWREARARGNKDIQTMCNRGDFDGWLMGLSKDESIGRRITLLKQWHGQPHRDIFLYTDGKYRCCPLSSWGWKDLAAYIAQHQIPMLDTYHAYGLEARTTARLTGMSAFYGGAASWRVQNPIAFNQLSSRIPEIRSMT